MKLFKKSSKVKKPEETVVNNIVKWTIKRCKELQKIQEEKGITEPLKLLQLGYIQGFLDNIAAQAKDENIDFNAELEMFITKMNLTE